MKISAILLLHVGLPNFMQALNLLTGAIPYDVPL